MRDACVLFLAAWFSAMGYLVGSADPPYWALFLISITAIPVMIFWSLLVEDLPSDLAADRAGGFMGLLARLGNFLYWVGGALAFFLFVGGVLAYLTAFAENKGTFLIMCWVAAAISYGLGSALRYILAGGGRA